MTVPDPATTDWVPIQGVVPGVDYWGQWSASRTYRDGDCVIWADGVLYLCTKNGTTTAPASWPGQAGPQGPIGPQGPTGTGFPLPVINGRWLKGVSGAAVWTPITIADTIPVNPGFVSGPTVSKVGPWPTSWSVTLPFKANVVLTVTASFYTGTVGQSGLSVQWDGAGLPIWDDMVMNETFSHKQVTATNTIANAAAGAHTIGIVYAANATSDSNDRATYALVAQAVP